MSDTFVPPEHFDEFRVIRPIGEGTMGAVYLCTDTVLYRRVAVKFLKTVAIDMDKGLRDRFLNEARAIAQLSHPNVVTIYRVGEVNTVLYLASEYITGKSLDHITLPLDAPMLVQVALGASLGLAAAHRQGILHRDTKPANIMWTSGGEVKLLDFGLAKFLDALPVDSLAQRTASTRRRRAVTTSRQLTAYRPGFADSARRRAAVLNLDQSDGHSPRIEMSEQCLGTPLYMAPEAWRGERASTASDVYSLGAVLYELATGRAPFDDDDLLRLRDAALNDEIVPLAEAAPTLPPGLGQIIERCLRRNAAMRYVSGEALFSALESWVRSSVNGSFSSQNSQAALSSQSSRSSPRSAASSQLSHSALSAESATRPSWWRGLVVATGIAACASSGLWAWHRPGHVGGMVTLPSGMFLMGSSAVEVDAAQHWCRQLNGPHCDAGAESTFLREAPQHAVQVTRFRIDRREVCNQEFADWLNTQPTVRFVDDRYVVQDGHVLADLYPMYQPFGGLQYDAKRQQYVVAKSFGRRPITQVSWWAARAYCAARGGRLPTEAEWEYAARGPEGRRFPWGHDEPSCHGVAFARAEGMTCAGIAVGPNDVAESSQDRTEDGVHDLAGNVAEWVADAFAGAYQGCLGSCTDPETFPSAPESPATLRVVRGGTWLWSMASLRAATRSRFEQGRTPTNVGFRCAATLP